MMIADLLNNAPSITNGIWRISAPRSFRWSEAEYTQRQGVVIEADESMGHTLRGVLQEVQADMAGPALEIGCGTGALTLTLARYLGYPKIIASDISEQFIAITRNNLMGIDGSPVDYAILAAEDVCQFRPEILSAVYMASALHHILDWRAFLRATHRVLRPGGIVYFKEPCIELRIIFGLLFQMLISVAEAHGEPLTPAERHKISLFANSQVAYASQTLDKSKLEDKHCFRVDQVLAALTDCGYTYRYFTNAHAKTLQPLSLKSLLNQVVRVTAGVPPSVLDKMDRFMAPAIEYLYRFDQHKNPPYTSFICIAKKST